MVSSPRDEQEVNVILPCGTLAAYRSAGGRLPEQTERPIPGVKKRAVSENERRTEHTTRESVERPCEGTLAEGAARSRIP